MATYPDLVASSDVTPILTALTAAQLAALPAVITAASQAVQRHCDRALGLSSWEETHYPMRSRTIYLKNYPVQAITRFTGGLTEAINIRTADAATFSRATVAMNTAGDAPFTSATGITLFSRQSAVDTTTVLDFATSPTVQALGAAVNAVPGWVAEVNESCATWACSDLNIEPGARGAHVTVPLYAYDTELAGYDADFVTGRVVLGAGWVFGALPMSWVPDTFRYPDMTWGASRRYGGVRVSYTAGYSAVPEDVKLATIYTINSAFAAALVAGTFASEQSPEGYRYQLAARPLVVPEAARQLLAPYRRITA